MTVGEILRRLDSDIEFHETKRKNAAPTEYSMHATSVELLKKYREYLIRHQAYIELKCREIVDILRRV